jgi:hypothetical protein
MLPTGLACRPACPCLALIKDDRRDVWDWWSLMCHFQLLKYALYVNHGIVTGTPHYAYAEPVLMTELLRLQEACMILREQLLQQVDALFTVQQLCHPQRLLPLTSSQRCSA